MAKETFVRSKPKLVEDTVNGALDSVQSTLDAAIHHTVSSAHQVSDTLLSVAQVLAQLNS